MHGRAGSPTRWAARGATAVAMALALVAPLAACGSSGGSEATTTAAGDASTTAAGTETTADDPATTGEATTTTGATSTTALPDAGLGQRSAPPDGTGTALLTEVRVGANEGFERIVFEFEGEPMPGYRIGWVDGPITADGSGEPVEVDGDAYLEIVLQPASGVDMSAPELRITYEGPDRIDTAGTTEEITDLVRTGDFEAVLTWVAGTSERVPFRVLTLTSPTRIAIDLATGS